MFKQKILEFFWPPLRIDRIQRQLDAEERIGVFKMKREWDKRESARILSEFHRTPLWEETADVDY